MCPLSRERMFLLLAQACALTRKHGRSDRMPPRLCDLVSALFYDNRLRSDPARVVADCTARGYLNSARWDFLGVEQILTWHSPADVSKFGRQRAASAAQHTQLIQPPADPGEHQQGHSYMNPHEVAQMYHEYKKIRKRVGPNKLILVIAFYKAQIYLLQDAFKRAIMHGELVLIRTVDEAQGSEANIVMLSCVRNNKEMNMGFVGNRRRLCVALSRAKEELHVFGDKSTCMGSPIWAKAIAELEFLQSWDREVGQRTRLTTEAKMLAPKKNGRGDCKGKADPYTKKRGTNGLIA